MFEVVFPYLLSVGASAVVGYGGYAAWFLGRAGVQARVGSRWLSGSVFASAVRSASPSLENVTVQAELLEAPAVPKPVIVFESFHRKLKPKAEQVFAVLVEVESADLGVEDEHNIALVRSQLDMLLESYNGLPARLKMSGEVLREFDSQLGLLFAAVEKIALSQSNQVLSKFRANGLFLKSKFGKGLLSIR